jgi:hypothetical protein
MLVEEERAACDIAREPTSSQLPHEFGLGGLNTTGSAPRVSLNARPKGAHATVSRNNRHPRPPPAGVVQCFVAKETDLLPWVLGGMLALGAVAAIAVGQPDPAPGGAPSTPSAAASPSSVRAASSAAPAAHPAAPADLSPVAISTSARQQLPPGQVWECDVNGRRVFSDVQCGTHATVRQLSEPNVIDSAAAYPRGTSRPYGSGPGPGYYPQAASEAPPDDSDGGGDPIDTQVIVVHDRARRDQLARHGNHPHPRAAHP